MNADVLEVPSGKIAGTLFHLLSRRRAPHPHKVRYVLVLMLL